MKKSIMGEEPQRRIGIGRRSSTGSKPVRGRMVHHESGLERDLLVLLEADRSVVKVLQQPAKISYVDIKGRRRSYVPDFLVTFRDGSRTLYETKYRAELRAKWVHLRPRLRAAVAFAKLEGIRFKIMTECEIRTPYLANVRFLARFRPEERPVDDATEEHLVATLEVLGTASPSKLLGAAYASKDKQLLAMPVLWRLIDEGRIGANLSLALNMSSEIWVMDGWGTEWPGPHSHAMPLAHARWRRNGFPEPPPYQPPSSAKEAPGHENGFGDSESLGG